MQEEDPAWYSRVPEFFIEPVVDVEMNVSDIKVLIWSHTLE